MIDPAFIQCMARYNRWQNEGLYSVAGRLPDEERRRERGAFFGSIHRTFSHLLWADQIWMSRFSSVAPPGGGISQSVALYPDWEVLRGERAAFDEQSSLGPIGSMRRGLPVILLGFRALQNAKSPDRNGFSSPICSTTKRTTVDRCIAC